MKRLKRILPVLLCLSLLLGAAPAPAENPPQTPGEKVAEPRDQKEKIRTGQGVQPMTATEKKEFDAEIGRAHV